MAELNLDFTGIKRPSFEPIPEGEYVLLLSALKVAAGKNNPNNIVANGTYEVISDTDGNTEYSGRKIFNSQVVAGESARDDYTKLWLESLLDQELTGDFSLDPDQLVGLQTTAFVGVAPDFRDETKTVNVIKYFIPSF